MRSRADAYLDQDVKQFREDMELFAWASETLWHDQFRLSAPDHNERISLFPVALLRLAARRAVELFPHEE